MNLMGPEYVVARAETLVKTIGCDLSRPHLTCSKRERGVENSETNSEYATGHARREIVRHPPLSAAVDKPVDRSIHEPIHPWPMLAASMETIATVTDYPGLVAALAARRRALGLSLEELDERSGVQSGYSAKIECNMRNLGIVSLPSLLGALGLKIAIVVDPDARLRPKEAVTARGTGRTVRRDAPDRGGGGRKLARPLD